MIGLIDFGRRSLPVSGAAQHGLRGGAREDGLGADATFAEMLSALSASGGEYLVVGAHALAAALELGF